MAKVEWGTKRICLHCDARFYDFGRDPIICPNCGAEFIVEISEAEKLAADGPDRNAKSAKTGSSNEEADLPEDENDEVSLNELDEDDDDDTIPLDDIAGVAAEDEN